ERATMLAEAETALAAERRQWERSRVNLIGEVEGLENRILNYRRKLIDHEAALGQGPFARPAGAPPYQGGARLVATPNRLLLPAPKNLAPAPPLTPPSPPYQEGSGGVETDRRLEALDGLAKELADQRLHVAEQCERLLSIEQMW